MILQVQGDEAILNYIGGIIKLDAKICCTGHFGLIFSQKINSEWSFGVGGDVVALNTQVSPLFLLFCFLASGQDPPASRWPSGALVPGNIHIDLSPSSPEQAETKRVVGNFLWNNTITTFNTIALSCSSSFFWLSLWPGDYLGPRRRGFDWAGAAHSGISRRLESTALAGHSWGPWGTRWRWGGFGGSRWRWRRGRRAKWRGRLFRCWCGPRTSNTSSCNFNWSGPPNFFANFNRAAKAGVGWASPNCLQTS